MHLLGFAAATAAPDQAAREWVDHLGVLPGYQAEFIELRMAEAGAAASSWAAPLDATFAPQAAPSVASGGVSGSRQFVLPRAGKADLALFYDARGAYHRLPPVQRVPGDALLLVRGVVLCEPSTRIDGMADAGLGGGAALVAIPFDAMCGPAVRPVAAPPPTAPEARHAA